LNAFLGFEQNLFMAKRRLAMTYGPQLHRDRNAVLLDVDGTLLEIAARPDEVVVPDGLVATLRTLDRALGGALAIVSGRSVAAIDSLFRPERFVTAGCHGAEIRTREVFEIAAPVPPWIAGRAKALSSDIPGVTIEDKVYALSIHYRTVPDRAQQVTDIVESWRARLAADGFTILPGKRVLDIKPAAVSKGTAVRKLMSLAPFAGRVPVFAGDDITDEEVFAVLPEFDGVGLSVGRQMDGATFAFDTPAGIRSWLTEIAQAIGGKDKGIR
jgi:trehalose 6-phosphate phosphatase